VPAPLPLAPSKFAATMCPRVRYWPALLLEPGAPTADVAAPPPRPLWLPALEAANGLVASAHEINVFSPDLAWTFEGLVGTLREHLTARAITHESLGMRLLIGVPD
jgi:hypothetical protein